jgi:hypothetical protein
MPDYLEYQKSVAAEFKAYENRVRNLIDNRHWAEEGRFKEIILMNYLKRVLPKHLSVGTGFVRNQNSLTNQIDIIIYDNSFPVLFSEGDFIIATPENVIGIIEVKSRIEPNNICNIINRANSNAEIICGNAEKLLFNGIFSFNSGSNHAEPYIERMKSYDYTSVITKQHFNQVISNRLFSCVNHIALGNEYFIKLWPVRQSDSIEMLTVDTIASYYSMYNMNLGLAFSYFLSNLQEFIIRRATGYTIEELPGELSTFLYPIPEGKEAYLIDRIPLEKQEQPTAL